MSRPIVITRPLPGDPLARLAGAGFGPRRVWINPVDRRLSRRRLLEVVRGASAVLVTPADLRLDAEVFDAAGPALRMISAYAVGVDNIDVAEAARRGILVGHTPHAVTEPTADAAWLLILAAARRAAAGLDLVRSGRWRGVRPMDPAGQRLVGKTLLIVGPGRIGHATARRALGWEMSILYAARTRHRELERAPLRARRVSLAEGLRAADVVSLHTPLTQETRHLIGAAELALMKPSAVLVNTARGAVVDEAALIRALRTRRIFAAGLDVYEHEPQVPQALRRLDNVFLLPHWGSTTVEDRVWMTQIAVDNLIAALRGQPVPHLYAG
jgi:glyoxylate reductase